MPASESSTPFRVALHTPLPEDTLIFASMVGVEAVNTPFQYDLELLSSDSTLESAGLLRQPMTVTMPVDTAIGVRHFHGVVTRFSLVDHARDRCRYRARLAPRLALLSRTRNCRVFRKPLPWEFKSCTDELEGRTSIPNIVKHILTEHGVDFDDALLSPRYPELEYVVQYQESDLDFVSRLLEDAGIYCYFRHESDRHVLVLVDNQAAHPKVQDCQRLAYHAPEAHRNVREEHVYDWSVVRDLQPVAVAGADYDFVVPTQCLHNQSGKPGRLSEVFEYPAGYRDGAGARETMALRLEELECRFEEHSGITNARNLLVGRRFELVEHPRADLNAEYFVTEARFRITDDSYRSSASRRGEEPYTSYFSAIRDARQYRPPRRTRRPVIYGPQTAVVVGKSGEEISIDEHGRVAVRFHWERYAAQDEASSCLARVSQTWAGNGYGMWAIPRIGQEVIVEFLDGDPERPVITGCVYNGDNRPPFDAASTQFGIRSRSTKGSGPDRCNEIRFEDRRGKEELFIQAQDLQTTKVKGAQGITVGATRSLSVGGDSSTTVGGTRSLTVTKKDTQVFKDDQHLTVSKAYTADYLKGREVQVFNELDNEVAHAGKTTTVYGGECNINSNGLFKIKEFTDTLTMNEGIITVTNGDSAITLAKEKMTLHAVDELRLECGQASIVLKSDGTVEIHGSKLVDVASAKVTLAGGGEGANGAIELAAAGATMTGVKATLSSAGTTEITGLVVRIN